MKRNWKKNTHIRKMTKEIEKVINAKLVGCGA